MILAKRHGKAWESCLMYHQDPPRVSIMAFPGRPGVSWGNRKTSPYPVSQTCHPSHPIATPGHDWSNGDVVTPKVSNLLDNHTFHASAETVAMDPFVETSKGCATLIGWHACQRQQFLSNQTLKHWSYAHPENFLGMEWESSTCCNGIHKPLHYIYWPLSAGSYSLFHNLTSTSVWIYIYIYEKLRHKDRQLLCR